MNLNPENSGKHPEDLYQEAIKLSQAGKLEQAIIKLEDAVRLNPKFPDALEILGILYAKLDRLDEAIEVTKRLSHAFPNHLMAHTNLSRFYVQKGMILEAEQEQAEARRLSWKAELKAQKGTADQPSRSPEEIAQEQMKEIENKITRYQKVIALDPNDVLGYFSLGSAYLDAKRLTDAQAAFEKAIQADPKHSPSYFMLGLALEALGRRKEAAGIYKKGIPVAESKGDMIPLRKMEARLKSLEGNL